jgi:hypothetical protein
VSLCICGPTSPQFCKGWYEPFVLDVSGVQYQIFGRFTRL